ncbi:MAG TPA: hypothetical protein VLF90_01930 [Patescibacteria group bacterium]|nr:hypothetical protein [Patescibacteria group bacterium]
MKLPRKRLIIVGAALVIVLLVGGYLIHKNTPEQSGQGPTTTRKSTTQPGVLINTAPDTGNTKPSTTYGNTTPTTDVIAPSGSFVSNHHPTLSAPGNTMNSICRTNAGITCQINFTMGSEVKTLGPDTVGSDGTISWEWDLQKIGLTAGSWHVQAVAKSGSNTAATDDPLTLEISP